VVLADSITPLVLPNQTCKSEGALLKPLPVISTEENGFVDIL
jgi:hypothetical protein